MFLQLYIIFVYYGKLKLSVNWDKQEKTGEEKKGHRVVLPKDFKLKQYDFIAMPIPLRFCWPTWCCHIVVDVTWYFRSSSLVLHNIYLEFNVRSYRTVFSPINCSDHKIKKTKKVSRNQGKSTLTYQIFSSN